MFGRRPSPQAEVFETALSGNPPVDEAAQLAQLAASLRNLAAAPAVPPSGFERGRRMLHAELRASARPSSAGRLRAATMGIAGVAGAGILVASAATTTSPVTLLRDTVAALPGVTGHSPQETLVLTDLTGTVTQVTDDRVQLDLGDGDLLTVRLRADTVLRLEDGTPLAVDAVEPGQRIAIEAETRDGETTIRRSLTVLEPGYGPNTAGAGDPAADSAGDQPGQDPGGSDATGDRPNFVANPRSETVADEPHSNQNDPPQSGAANPDSEPDSAAGSTEPPPKDSQEAGGHDPNDHRTPGAGTSEPVDGADSTEPPVVATTTLPTHNPTRSPSTDAATDPPTPTPKAGGPKPDPDGGTPVDVFAPNGSIGNNSTVGDGTGSVTPPGPEGRIQQRPRTQARAQRWLRRARSAGASHRRARSAGPFQARQTALWARPRRALTPLRRHRTAFAASTRERPGEVRPVRTSHPHPPHFERTNPMTIPRTIRWLALTPFIALALFGATALASAQAGDTAATDTNADVSVLAARLKQVTPTDCAVDQRPHGFAVLRQQHVASDHRATLEIRVEGLRCRAGEHLFVIVATSSGRHVVGRIAINDGGSGHVLLSTGAGAPLPLARPGDVVALADREDGELFVMAGHLRKVRHTDRATDVAF